MKLSEYQRSRSFFDPGQRSLRFQSISLFFSETVGWFVTKVHMKAYGRMGMKIYTNEFGHMTNMVAMRIYGKNLKNLLLQKQYTDDLETWYVALSMQVLQRLFKL